MKSLAGVPRENLRSLPVLVRADLNVPVKRGNVENGYRALRALGTLSYLHEMGARTIVISHMGRSKSDTLSSVAEFLKKHINITFVPDIIGKEAMAVSALMRDGEIILLENLRQNEGEEKNDEDFAKALASLAEIYVNDAFASSHRKHASIVGVPKFLPHYAGFLFEEEVAELSAALSPRSPSLCILGGAKFDTKEPLIKKLLETYDHVFVGGALANDIFSALGFQIGRSLVSAAPPSDGIFENGRMLIPVDVVAQKADGSARVARADDVEEDEKIVDIGPKSVDDLEPYIRGAEFILWNGPMGVYEEGFDTWTRAIARIVANSKGYAVVGGGDTVATIHEMGLEKKCGFVSTGGGAMLEFLLDGTLPGIDALAE